MGSSRRWKRLSVGLFIAGMIAARPGGRTDAEAVQRRLTFHDHFASGKLDAWQFPYPEDWEVRAEGSRHFLHMKRNREPGVPRRPLQFALLNAPKVGSFELETLVRREGHSMIVVFNYVDTLHFYYIHLSVDRGTEQPVHNGVFLVCDGPRKRIAGAEAPPALPDRDWHGVRLIRDAATGSIEVFLDNQKQPLFSTRDLTLQCGQVGLGSFDETGDFAEVELASEDAGCESRCVLRPPGIDQTSTVHLLRTH